MKHHKGNHDVPLVFKHLLTNEQMDELVKIADCIWKEVRPQEKQVGGWSTTCSYNLFDYLCNMLNKAGDHANPYGDDDINNSIEFRNALQFAKSLGDLNNQDWNEVLRCTKARRAEFSNTRKDWNKIKKMVELLS